MSGVGPSGDHKAKSPPISAKTFVQRFYDWYALQANNDKNDGPAWEIAVRQKPEVFAPKLLNALKEDIAVSAKAQGYIVGLDCDPILCTQDPGQRYFARSVKRFGSSSRVGVYEAWKNWRSPSPVAYPVVRMRNGRWQFTNFFYPGGADALTTLRLLKEDRRLHPIKPDHR